MSIKYEYDNVYVYSCEKLSKAIFFLLYKSSTYMSTNTRMTMYMCIHDTLHVRVYKFWKNRRYL